MGDEGAHACHARAIGVYQRPGLTPASNRFPHRDDVVLYAGYVTRGEEQDLGLHREITDRAAELVSRWRAYTTEILGDNDVGTEIPQQHLVDLVHRRAALHPLGDGAIDRSGRIVVKRERGAADHGERRHRRGIVAFVRPADELVTCAKGVDDFSSGRKKGNDPRHFYRRSQYMKRPSRSTDSPTSWLTGRLNGGPSETKV
jgi:hypothetical protein